jgi:hypothetical protein
MMDEASANDGGAHETWTMKAPIYRAAATRSRMAALRAAAGMNSGKHMAAGEQQTRPREHGPEETLAELEAVHGRQAVIPVANGGPWLCPTASIAVTYRLPRAPSMRGTPETSAIQGCQKREVGAPPRMAAIQ